VENPFAGSAAIVRTPTVSRLFRSVHRVQASWLNENLLYIPCTPFPLPFFSPAHILINGSFLRECNVWETKSRRRDWSHFISLSPVSSISFYILSFLPPCSRARSNRSKREFPHRSYFFMLLLSSFETIRLIEIYIPCFSSSSRTDLYACSGND